MKIEKGFYFWFCLNFLTHPLCSATALAGFLCLLNVFTLGWPGNSGVVVHVRMTLWGDLEHFWKPWGKRCALLVGYAWGKTRCIAHAKGSHSLAALLPLTKDSPGCPGSPHQHPAPPKSGLSPHPWRQRWLVGAWELQPSSPYLTPAPTWLSPPGKDTTGRKKTFLSSVPACTREVTQMLTF